MVDASSFILSVVLLGVVFTALFLYGMPDIILAVVGVGFILGLFAVFAEVHSLQPLLGVHEPLSPQAPPPPPKAREADHENHEPPETEDNSEY
jgi:hypothetical protein